MALHHAHHLRADPAHAVRPPSGRRSGDRACILSHDRALVTAARRVFACAGLVVSVYKSPDEYFAATDAAGRRCAYVVLDARAAVEFSAATRERLEGRGQRVLVVGPLGPQAHGVGLRFPTVDVHGDYAPVSAVLQDWLAARPVSSSAETAESEGRLLRIDDAAHEVYAGDRRLPLRPAEHALLRFFLERPHHLFSRADLLRLLWGEQTSVELRTVDVHIMRLRKALRPYGLEGFIETVFGFGYRANHAVLDPASAEPLPPIPLSSPSSTRNVR